MSSMTRSGVWQTHTARAVLIGLNAFTVLLLFLIWVATGELDFLKTSFLLFILGPLGKVLKAASRSVSPTMSQRPLGADGCRAFYGWPGASQTGMPSGHSMGAAAMAVYAHHFILAYNAHGSERLNTAASVVVYLVALLVAWSRVIYGCHTPAQVVIGLAIGYFYGVWTSRMFLSAGVSTTGAATVSG